MNFRDDPDFEIYMFKENVREEIEELKQKNEIVKD